MLGGVSKQIRHDADIDKLVFTPAVVLVTCHGVLRQLGDLHLSELQIGMSKIALFSARYGDALAIAVFELVVSTFVHGRLAG